MIIEKLKILAAEYQDIEPQASRAALNLALDLEKVNSISERSFKKARLRDNYDLYEILDIAEPTTAIDCVGF